MLPHILGQFLLPEIYSAIAPERSSDLMRHCVYDLLLTIFGRRQIRQTQNYILYSI